MFYESTHFIVLNLHSAPSSVTQQNYFCCIVVRVDLNFSDQLQIAIPLETSSISFVGLEPSLTTRALK